MFNGEVKYEIETLYAKKLMLSIIFQTSLQQCDSNIKKNILYHL